VDVARLIVAWKKHLGNFSLEVEWTSDKADSLVRLLRPLIDAQHLSIPTTVRVLTGVFAASASLSEWAASVLDNLADRTPKGLLDDLIVFLVPERHPSFGRKRLTVLKLTKSSKTTLVTYFHRFCQIGEAIFPHLTFDDWWKTELQTFYDGIEGHRKQLAVSTTTRATTKRQLQVALAQADTEFRLLGNTATGRGGLVGGIEGEDQQPTSPPTKASSSNQPGGMSMADVLDMIRTVGAITQQQQQQHAGSSSSSSQRRYPDNIRYQPNKDNNGGRSSTTTSSGDICFQCGNLSKLLGYNHKAVTCNTHPDSYHPDFLNPADRRNQRRLATHQAQAIANPAALTRPAGASSAPRSRPSPSLPTPHTTFRTAPGSPTVSLTPAMIQAIQGTAHMHPDRVIDMVAAGLGSPSDRPNGAPLPAGFNH